MASAPFARARLAVVSLALVAGATVAGAEAPDPRDAFFETISGLCGATFEGTMSFPPDPEHAFAGKALVAHIARCDEREIRVPFAVGEDRSRTWLLTRRDGGLLLKHDHRHEDGSPDEITMYGGWATEDGDASSQSFPADDHTRELIPEAATNVWHLSLSADGLALTYYLERHDKPRFKATLERQTVDSEARAPLPPPGEMARCKELIDAGLHGAARSRLQPIVDRHPGWARAVSLLGLTYYKESRFETAARLFGQALAADPEEISARPPYGWSLYSLGRLDDAQAMFESLLDRRPDYAPAHYALGVVALDRDETQVARRRFDRTVELALGQGDPPMAGRAHARLGDLYLRLDDLEAARQELETALELLPDERDALFSLSRVLQRLGDARGAEEARRKFEEAKTLAGPATARLPG